MVTGRTLPLLVLPSDLLDTFCECFGIGHSQGFYTYNTWNAYARPSTVQTPLPMCFSTSGHAYGVFQPVVRASQG